MPFASKLSLKLWLRTSLASDKTQTLMTDDELTVEWTLSLHYLKHSRRHTTTICNVSQYSFDTAYTTSPRPRNELESIAMKLGGLDKLT